MSNIRLALLALGIALISYTFAWAEKITVDPNQPGNRASTIAWKDKVDPRLSQKITYDGGSKRLYVVLQDLSRISGVKIACGQNSGDWRVRDIPVVVCVKDMQLGKLLRAITDATHTKFTSERIGRDPEKRYRIYRRSKEKAEIDEVLKAKREAEQEYSKWQWNALAAYGKGKDSAELPRGPWSNIPRETWLIGRLIATTGPNSDERLIDGDTFRFRASDPACRDVMSEIYQLRLKSAMNTKNSDGSQGEMPEDMGAEKANAAIEIRLQGTGMAAYLELRSSESKQSWYDVGSEMRWVDLLADLDELGLLKDTGIKLPVRPDAVKMPSHAYDMDNPTMTDLSKLDKWDFNALNTKFDLEKPKDVDKLVFADLIRGVSTAVGCNIVVEDFVSHMDARYQRIGKYYSNDICIADIFRGMSIEGQVDYSWFLDADAKLLVGWADGSYLSWRENHTNLVSEAYLNYLRDKLNGDGVSFDVAVEILRLAQDASQRWVACSKDLGCLEAACFCNDSALWQLYSSLHPEDKLAARSKDGLRLGKFDSAWLAGYFRSMRTSQTGHHTFYSSEERRREAEAERASKEQAISDPKIISTMVMHIEKKTADYRAVKTMTSDTGTSSTTMEVPKALKLSQYSMVIDYMMNGEKHKMDIPYSPQLVFPVRSAEREAEIIKGLE